MKAFLAYSLDTKIRHKATSGGVGSGLLKFLLDTGAIETSISFDYDSASLSYTPKIIHSYAEYRCVGSIYHDVGLVRFICDHVTDIRGGFACFCLPCEAQRIRRIVENAERPCTLLGLTCSAQQRHEATLCLLKMLKLNLSDVSRLQYRGNGWPSGIQIELKSGQKVFVQNDNSIWTEIFHSRLFMLPRCFFCSNTVNTGADISLADPWLPSLQEGIEDGKTLVLVNTPVGETLWSAAQRIVRSHPVSEADAIMSQQTTIKRKDLYQQCPFRRKCLMMLNRSGRYRQIVTSSPVLLRLHSLVRILLERPWQ